VLKAESDVSGGLNDGLQNLRDVFIFDGEQMIAANGLLESGKSNGIGNESFASIEIDGSAVNLEVWQIVEAQMKNGCDGVVNVVSDGMDGKDAIQLCEEVRVNFATAQNIARVARHTAGMIFTHPLQIVWIVTASFKATSVPRPKALALSAEHLVTALGLVDENLAIGTRLCVGLEKSDRSNGVGVANMCGIIAFSLELPAMRAGVLVTGCTLPSGRHEAVAVGISTAVNELFGLVHILCGTLTLQLILGDQQIGLECLKLLDLCVNVLYLVINALDEPVMRDGSLSCREHGLFLCKENVLLVLGEIALKECLGKTEMLEL
jgi:hypothetical protein